MQINDVCCAYVEGYDPSSASDRVLIGSIKDIDSEGTLGFKVAPLSRSMIGMVHAYHRLYHAAVAIMKLHQNGILTRSEPDNGYRIMQLHYHDNFF